MKLWMLTATAVLTSSIALAQDTDGDGADDVVDAYPCDPTLASTAYAPSASSWQMLVYEDQWPSYTDLDFNDVVVRTHFRVLGDAQGRAVRIHAFFDVVALGGIYSNGLAVQVPVSRSVAVARRRVAGGAWQSLPAQTDNDLTVVLSNDLRELFNGRSGRINSIAADTYVAGQMIEVEIDLLSPTALSGLAPFDLFVFRAGDFGHQIHFPPFGGTQAMNGSLFNTENDNSQPGRHFVHRNGIPFALDLQGTSVYPQEGVSIDQLFPNIIVFAASNGAQAQDFYLSNTVISAGYLHAPRAVPGESPADLSCDCTDFGTCTYSWQTGAYGTCSADAQWTAGPWGTCSANPSYSTSGWSSCSANASWSAGGWSSCSANPSYSTGAWGACNVSCGNGTQSRSVSCVNTAGTQTRNVSCPTASGSQSRSVSCVNTAGTQARNVSCAAMVGAQTRTVTCLREETGETVADSFCATPKPALSQACTDNTCSGSQPVSSQSCTQACSGNPPASSQSCTDTTCSGSQPASSQSCTQGCSGSPPASSQACNAGPCLPTAAQACYNYFPNFSGGRRPTHYFGSGNIYYCCNRTYGGCFGMCNGTRCFQDCGYISIAGCPGAASDVGGY